MPRRASPLSASVLASLLLSVAHVAATPSGSDRVEPGVHLISAELVGEMRATLAKEIVSLAIRNQNRRHERLDAVGIARLDETWVAERAAERKPLISATLANPLSNYLTRVQAHSGGLFVEIFVVDAHGLNVGQSNITSDFWQGDEAKFQKTFPLGPTAVFVDEAEYDDESGTWRAQVNLSIADVAQPDVAIGAATFEVNLTELARRAAL